MAVKTPAKLALELLSHVGYSFHDHAALLAVGISEEPEANNPRSMELANWFFSFFWFPF